MLDKTRTPCVFTPLNYWERPRSKKRIPPGGRTTVVLFNDHISQVDRLVKEESKRHTPRKDNEINKILSNSNLSYDSYRTSRRIHQNSSSTSILTYELMKDYQQDSSNNCTIPIHSLRKTTFDMEKSTMKSILDHEKVMLPKKYSRCSPGGPTTISLT